MKLLRTLILLLCLFSLSCTSDAGSGIVATVNGKPISLRLVEVQHNVGGALSTVSQHPSVSLLRRQYGEILAELIVQELASQELESLGLEVTDVDVDEALKQIRADYPEEIFNETLLAENIDEAAWRELLRYSLVIMRFNEKALKPKVSLSDSEVNRYYEEHAAEFLIPAHMSLITLSSASRDNLEIAAQKLKEGDDVSQISAMHSGVQVQRLNMRENQSPEIWRKTLSQMKPHDISYPIEIDGIWQVVYLERHERARRMSALEAYNHIEETLTARKMGNIFAEWLDMALDRADIRMTKLLVLGKESKEKTSEEEYFRNTEPIDDASDESSYPYEEEENTG